VTIDVSNEIGDSSVDCQTYIAFVIEVVGTLGLSIGPSITWNEITLERTDEPITTGIVRKLVVARVLFRMLDGTRYRDNSPTRTTRPASILKGNRMSEFRR